MHPIYIGLMSGTSLDGVDGVLVGFGAGDRFELDVAAHVHLPFDALLAQELLALNDHTDDELHRAALAGNALAARYAEVVHALLRDGGVARERVLAIGAHGQTVRHRPLAFDGVGYTLQLINPSLLAERTGIDVVADFRSRDIAAGGQGAPLVPAFNQVAFGQPGITRGVLNIGGISNLTVLNEDRAALGFDCGPGNALMDHWCRAHIGAAFDAGGGWAATGRIVPELLHTMLGDPYFCIAPPKSTGRDLFNPAWLARQLRQASVEAPAAEDVQATLAELTARSCAAAVRTHAADAADVLTCGGGSFNTHLIQRLEQLLAPVAVQSTAVAGVPPMQVEAVAFAWLARAFCERQPGNLPSATGACGPRILGGLYPGR